MGQVVLIVEDEPDLAEIVRYSLEKEGYLTRVAANGQEALVHAQTEPRPDLVLLDLMLPDMSGNEICRTLKGDPEMLRTPIIMVTARDDEIDRIVGFELGADDYVTKPFSVRELLLRVRAVLRRSAREPEASHTCLVAGAVSVDLEAHRVWTGDVELQLTPLEFKLLVTFLQRRGRVQTRDRLLEDVWGYNVDVTTRTVDTHVKRLRVKLGDAGSVIETVRGIGYRCAEASRNID
jgi:two-component system phosphate regulon response regulator PhoB